MSDYYGSSSPDERSNVTARVKWFNTTKGFGFIQVSPDEPDVFIHASVVSPTGVTDLPPGTTLECDIARAARGLQVTRIHRVDLTTAEQPSYGGPRDRFERPGGYDRGGFERGGGYDRGSGDEYESEGMVKFFDSNKGFGFVVPDGGGRDIFIPGRVLPKTGVVRLEPDQRVRVRWREGDRGPLATRVELA